MPLIEVSFKIGDKVWAIDRNYHVKCIAACNGSGRLKGPGFYDGHDACPACSGNGWIWSGKRRVRVGRVSGIRIRDGITYDVTWLTKRPVTKGSLSNGDTWGAGDCRAGEGVFATQKEARRYLASDK